MFLASGLQYEFYSQSFPWHGRGPHLCWGAVPLSLCHTGRGSEQTGNTVTSVFPTSVCPRDRDMRGRRRTVVKLERLKEKGENCEHREMKKKLFLRPQSKHTHTQKESYHLALSLSSPPVSSASAYPLRLPGFLCGAPEFQMLIRSAGRFAPGPPPPACVGKWNCSGRSTGNTLYCCQIPVDKQKLKKRGRKGNKGRDLY